MPSVWRPQIWVLLQAGTSLTGLGQPITKLNYSSIQSIESVEIYQQQILALLHRTVINNYRPMAKEFYWFD